jgi:carbamate kinase
MRVVVALGGNALLERGERADACVQRRHMRAAARALAPLAAEHQLILCHGNGPQVGMLAVESEDDRSLSSPYPLDVLGAQTQGMIGYWLAQELRNAGIASPIACVLTQTVVDSFDPAFEDPTKFVGPVYDRHRAVRLAKQRNWHIAPDGQMWRRVVASPQPRRVLEQSILRQLVYAHNVVVCAGGGGAPVIEDDTGQMRGVDAVVDKDLVAALIAKELLADALLVLTDVPGVMRNFGSDAARVIPSIEVADLRAADFPDGSMRPKIDACVRYVEATHGLAVIGALADASRMLDGTAGTVIVPNDVERHASMNAHANQA